MHTRNESGGFTFVELMIAMAVFAIISTVGIRLVLNGTGAYRQGISVADLEARTSRTLERVVRELSKASSASIVVLSPMVGVQLDFQQSQGVVGTAVQWGPQMRYALVMTPGELDNGVDDNGNGLIDERSLMQVEDLGGPNERRIVIVNGVAELLEGELPNGLDDNGNLLNDEGGFSITIQSGPQFELDTVTLRLTLQALDPQGQLMQRTLNTTIALRS